MMKPIKCSVCKTPLVVTCQLPLETLEEHVFCLEPSVKDVYTCPNHYCDACGLGGKRGIMWNEDGEFYGDPTGIKFVGKLRSALDSAARYGDKHVERERRWKFTLKLYWIWVTVYMTTGVVALYRMNRADAWNNHTTIKYFRLPIHI